MKKMIWLTISIISILGLVIFAYGFGQSIKIGIEVNQAPEEPQLVMENSPEPLDVKSILAMGDSLARGTGDINGQGFVGLIAAAISDARGEPVPLFNISMEGLRTSMLLSQINEPNTIDGIRSANLILISIGGNDIRSIEEVDSAQKSQYYQETLETYTSQLKEVLTKIRAENKDAFIVFLGLYNLNYNDSNAENSSWLIEWNHSTQKLVESFENTIFTPTYDLFKLNSELFISADGLHPNSEGHKAIADRILKNINYGTFFE
ncbi:GDSL-type esterase/lipase family protein [Gudongella sp. DL1XJH-153]|uniref:GDSL-type esterase/lipase family protein n=1 Tax=Gudongella sp. DL1XJH-153 TaxID=3409804 RepID=UPI003BB570F6